MNNINNVIDLLLEAEKYLKELNQNKLDIKQSETVAKEVSKIFKQFVRKI